MKPFTQVPKIQKSDQTANAPTFLCWKLLSSFDISVIPPVSANGIPIHHLKDSPRNRLTYQKLYIFNSQSPWKSI